MNSENNLEINVNNVSEKENSLSSSTHKIQETFAEDQKLEIEINTNKTIIPEGEDIISSELEDNESNNYHISGQYHHEVEVEQLPQLDQFAPLDQHDHVIIETSVINNQNVNSNNQIEENSENINQNGNQPAHLQGDSEDAFINILNGLTNTHMIVEESIEGIRNLLCSTADTPFHQLSMKDSNLKDKFLGLIKEKAKIADLSIGETLSYYHKKLLESQLSHLDKLMKILKCNKRELHLKRIKPQIKPHLSEEVAENKEYTSNKSIGDSADYEINIMEILNPNSIGSILMNKKLLPEYNPRDKSLKFQINDIYEVHLKAFEERSAMKNSIFDNLPLELFLNHLFPYFTSFELFKLRGVCNEWREMVRSVWHVLFKREMLEQILAAELCNEIEMNFKLMQIRTPFFQKFGMYMKAIIDVIEWNILLPQLNHPDLDNRYKMVILSIFKLLGLNVHFDRLSDFQVEHWEAIKAVAIDQLPEFLNMVFEPEFYFPSNSYLEEAKEKFLDCVDISSFNIRSLNDKNLTLLHIFCRQLLVFSQLKNCILLAQQYVMITKDRLKEVSKRWISKKGFLEGAYKILLFRFVKIQNGNVTLSNDHEEENIKEELFSNIEIQTDQSSDYQNLNHSSNKNIDIINEKKIEETEIVQVNQNIEAIHNDNEEEIKYCSLEKSLLEKELKIIETSNINELSEDLQIATELKSDSANSVEKINISKIKEASIEIKKSEAKEECESIEPGNIFSIEFTKEKCENQQDLSDIDLDKFNPNNDEHNQNLALALHDKLTKLTSDLREGKKMNNNIPDYIIRKNGTETRIFLDDETRVELLLQKLLKLHLLIQAHKQYKLQQLNENLDSSERDEEEIDELDDEELNSLEFDSSGKLLLIKDQNLNETSLGEKNPEEEKQLLLKDVTTTNPTQEDPLPHSNKELKYE